MTGVRYLSRVNRIGPPKAVVHGREGKFIFFPVYEAGLERLPTFAVNGRVVA